jgi:arsenate reductase
MAETILREMSKGEIDVCSAGNHPRHEIHPMARLAIQRLLRTDMAGQQPKSVEPFVGQHFDYVITVCDRAAEHCPVFPDDPERIHWGFEDPAAAAGKPDDRQRVFNRVSNEIAARIRVWMALPGVRNRTTPDDGRPTEASSSR